MFWIHDSKICSDASGFGLGGQEMAFVPLKYH